MDGKTDYISQMVSETFEHLDEAEEGNVVALARRDVRPYHHNQLEMSFEETSSRASGQAGPEVSFDRNRLCLSINLQGQVLEIPVNWGPFRWMDFSNPDTELDFKLKRREDSDGLFAVLEEYFDVSVENLHIYATSSGLRLEFNALEGSELAA